MLLLATGYTYFGGSDSQNFLNEDPMAVRFEAWKAKNDKHYGGSEHEERF